MQLSNSDRYIEPKHVPAPELAVQEHVFDLPALSDAIQYIITPETPNHVLDEQRILDALHTVGPAPSLIAKQVGLAIKRVNLCLELNDEVRKAYSSVVVKIARSLVDHRCNFGEVAVALGVHRSSVLKWVEENRYLRDIQEDVTESITDDAVSKLYDSINLGKQWAIEKQLNSTSGKKRGYGEGQQVGLVDELSRLGLIAADIRIEIRQKFIKPLIQVESPDVNQKIVD